MIKKLTVLKYNILSAVNVLTGFLLTICIMKYFGATKDVDKYFTSLLIVININVLAGFFYFSFLQHYLKLKNTNRKKSNELYFSIIFLSFIISILVLLFYQIILSFVNFENLFFNDFLKYFIFLIILIPIFEINNFLINSNSYYAFTYILLVINNLFNLIAILFFNYIGIEVLIYSTILGYLVSIFIQFLFIFLKIKIQFSINFDLGVIKNVIKSSFILKLSSIINGTTDMLIAYFLTNVNEGVYSIYSYARKFALGVFNVANGPMIKRFNTDVANLIHTNKFNLIFREMKKTAIHIIPIFIIGEIITYYLLKILLVYTSTNFSEKEINTLQSIFLILSFYYVFLTCEYLLNAIINQFHEFNMNLKINTIFAVNFAILSFLFFYYTNDYYLIIVSLPIVLIISIFLELKFVLKKVN